LSVPPRNEFQRTKMRLLPAAQVDYNIITNNKVDDFYFQNVRLNVETKKVTEIRGIFSKYILERRKETLSRRKKRFQYYF